MARIHFLGVPVDILSESETIGLAVDAMRRSILRRHVALNVAKFVTMRHNEELHRDVVESDIIGIDGMGIIVALRLFGYFKGERVPGIDLMEGLMARCASEGFRPYVLGAKREVLDRALAVARERWPGLEFAGSRDGYFTPEQEAAVVADIARSGADCLFVAMPTPRKEQFLHRNAGRLNVPFIMGVGGSIDVLAGLVKRAPRWMQRSGLEWFYRIEQEPRRMFWRYASTNTRFVGILAGALAGRLLGRTVIQAEAP
jgi:N-acetylglucosaminyldiphosphoundecaprenol N-acetyl-beta-D-mannosaminyltransferase